MDQMKKYVAFTVLGCLAVLAAGWLFVVSPKRSAAAELRDQAAATEQSNAQLRTKLTVLKGQAKDLPKEQAKLAAVAAKIPDNPALPSLIRALVAAGTASGVELVSVTPGTPVAPVVAPAAAAAAPAAPGAAPAAGAPAPPAPVAGAVAPGGAAGTLMTVPVSLNVAGGYFQIQQFLSELENLPRAFRVSALTLAPGANPVKPNALTGAAAEDGRALTATVTGEVFLAQNRPAATAVVVPGQPVRPATRPVAPAPTSSK